MEGKEGYLLSCASCVACLCVCVRRCPRQSEPKPILILILNYKIYLDPIYPHHINLIQFFLYHQEAEFTSSCISSITIYKLHILIIFKYCVQIFNTKSRIPLKIFEINSS